jgi:hypothetical protein
MTFKTIATATIFAASAFAATTGSRIRRWLPLQPATARRPMPQATAT